MVVFNEAEINYDHSSGDIVVSSRYNSKEVGKDGNKIIGSISILILQNGRTLQSPLSVHSTARSDIHVISGNTGEQSKHGYPYDARAAELGQTDFDVSVGHCQEKASFSQPENNYKYSVPSSLSLIPLCVPIIHEQVKSKITKDGDQCSDSCDKEDGTGSRVVEKRQELGMSCINVVDTSNFFKKGHKLCEEICQPSPFEVFDNGNANVVGASDISMVDSVSGDTILQPTLPPDLVSFDSCSFDSLRFQTEQNPDHSSFYGDNYWAHNAIIPPSISKNTTKTPLNIPRVPLVNRLMKSNQSKPGRSYCNKLVIGQEFNEKKKHVAVNFGAESCLFCQEVLVTHENVVGHALYHANSFSDEIFCPVCSMVFKNNEINDLLQHAYTHTGNKPSQKSVSPASSQKSAMIGENFSLADSATRLFEDNSSDRLSENFTAKIEGVISELGSGITKDTSDLEPDDASLDTSSENFTAKIEGVISELGSGITKDTSDLEPDDASLDTSNMKLDKLKRKQITKNTISHSCCVCRKTIASYTDILKHQKIHGPSNSCPICGVEFTQRGSFMRHAASHMRTALFMCQMCPSVFTRKDNLKRHIDKHGMYSRPMGKAQRLVKKKPWRFAMYYAQAANRLKKIGMASDNNVVRARETIGKSLVTVNDSSDTEIVDADVDNEGNSYMSGNSSPSSEIICETKLKEIVPSMLSEKENQTSIEIFSESNEVMDTKPVDMNTSVNKENVIIAKEEVQRRNLFDDLIFSISENDEHVSRDDVWEKSDEAGPSGNETKSPNINYTCTDCKEEFCKLESLKKHMVICHSEQKQVSFIDISDDVSRDEVSSVSNIEYLESQASNYSDIKKSESCGNIKSSCSSISDVETNLEFHSSVGSDMFESVSYPTFFNIKKEKEIFDECPLKETIDGGSTMLLPSEIKKEPMDCGRSLYEHETGFQNATSVSDEIGPSQLSFEDNVTFPTNSLGENRCTLLKVRKNTQHAQCSYCDVEFATASEISQHCTIHRDMVLNHFTTCPVCRIELSTRGGLHRHAATHIGIIFSCGHCSAKFSRKDNLKRHVKLNHGADLEIY